MPSGRVRRRRGMDVPITALMLLMKKSVYLKKNSMPRLPMILNNKKPRRAAALSLKRSMPRPAV